MHAKDLTPILNVSDIRQSFAWFEKLGWKEGLGLGESPDVWGGLLRRSARSSCARAPRGGPAGKSDLATTFGSGEGGRQGRLDVDLGGRRRRHPPPFAWRQGLEVTHPPTDEPLVRPGDGTSRHPDGHVLPDQPGDRGGENRRTSGSPTDVDSNPGDRP